MLRLLSGFFVFVFQRFVVALFHLGEIARLHGLRLIVEHSTAIWLEASHTSAVVGNTQCRNTFFFSRRECITSILSSSHFIVLRPFRFR